MFGIVNRLSDKITTNFMGLYKNKIPIYEVKVGKVSIYVTIVNKLIYVDTDYNMLIKRLNRDYTEDIRPKYMDVL